MTEEREHTTVSSDLLAAQTRLLNLRRERRLVRLQQGLLVQTDENGRFLSPTSPAPAAPLSDLPTHLGWDSDAVTSILQRVDKQRVDRQQPARPPLCDTLPHRSATTTQPILPKTRSSAATVKLYPDIALGMLQAELAAPGRVWLLLRYLDAQGNGWVRLDLARAQLTQRQSPLRVCGWRQLRNLLHQGEDVFWQRQRGRIWLRSVVKVAAALHVWRLISRPVALKVSVLTQRIGKVRAHFYASFHSGRNRETAVSPVGCTTSTPHATPIARATLQQITHVHPRTQRRYDAQIRVQRHYNYALGQQVNAAAVEQQAWQHGHALFQFTDAQGLQGPTGTTYFAWQLPNDYVGPHQPQPRGRQKRHNRELVDLFMQGMTGNSKETVHAYFRQKRFYRHGKAAAKALNRGQQGVYWFGPQRFWYCLASSDEKFEVGKNDPPF